MVYLAEKYQVLMPLIQSHLRYEVIKWLMFGSSTVSAQFKLFGFYFKYCKHNLPYCVERYTKEVNRILNIVEKQLSHDKHYLTGGESTSRKSEAN